jgi:hypothetical protein
MLNTETVTADHCTVRVIVTNERPTTYDVEGGRDYDVEVVVTDECGEKYSTVGGITLAPRQYDGVLDSYGSALDQWVGGPLCRVLHDRHPVWSHDGVRAAIVASMRTGLGEETIEVSL